MPHCDDPMTADQERALAEADGRSAVYMRVAAGVTVDEIADQLGMDEQTVARYAADCPPGWANNDNSKPFYRKGSRDTPILSLVRKGTGNPEIAAVCGVSVPEVSRSLKRLEAAGRINKALRLARANYARAHRRPAK